MDEMYPRWEARVVGLPGAAATAGVSYVIPGASRIRLRAVTFKLVTLAGVANRIAVVSLFKASGDAVVSVAAPFVQTASKTSLYTFGEGLQQFGANDAARIGGPFVGGCLPENLTLAVSVLAAQAGDVLSGVRLLLEQHVEQP